MEFVDYINLPPYGVANFHSLRSDESLDFSEQPIIEKQNKNKSDKSLDSVVQSVINSFIERSKVGIKKYGTDLDRTDLSFLDWVQHAQEEHMDAILYLEKMKQTHNMRCQK
jgi:hypothetical protein